MALHHAVVTTVSYIHTPCFDCNIHTQSHLPVLQRRLVVFARQIGRIMAAAAASADGKPKRRRGRQGKQEESKTTTKNNSNKKASSMNKGGKNNDSSNNNNNSKQKSMMISIQNTTWYDYCSDTPGRNATTSTHPSPTKGQYNTPAMILKFQNKADELMREEVALLSSSKDEAWVESTMKKGTLKDRIAAMSVLVSTHPIHKQTALDQLLDLAVHQANTRVAQMAAEALEDLFINTLLVPTRKLIPMQQRPIYLYDTANTTISPRILLLWRFEDLMISKYNTFITGYLQATFKNGMEVSKLYCLKCASRLLRGTPQGEDVVLSMMVNKLGDPDKKIASAAGHELRRVLEQYPSMQVVVAREVQQLAHRPALSPKALYHCIIFLNQLTLSTNEQNELPASLITTYFRLFDVATKESKTTNNDGMLKGRLLGALLTGVHRAHPYLTNNNANDALNAHMDQLYRLVHTAPPSASTQALLLLFHVAVGNNNNNKQQQQQQTPGKTSSSNSKNDDDDDKTKIADRFYRALYAKLASLSNGKHLTIFFNLLYKAMKYDVNETRVIVFSKRLLCTCLHAPAPIVAASLYLVNEVMKSHSTLRMSLTQALETDAMLDATKREPKSALVMGDDGTTTTITAGLWEDQLLQHHVHPSVSKFAITLGQIEYQGDPLKDFGLAPFLDKFAYKNPKKHVVKKAESIAERHSSDGQQPLPVNDPSFLTQRDVGEDDVFFQKFFRERARRDTLKGIVRHKGMDDDEDDRYKEKRRDEDEAFEMAEGADADHARILEEGWETDPEEEDFVDHLAEQLMENHAATTGGDAVDFDDEDPDMEGWDDINDEDVDVQDDIADGDDEDDISEGVESSDEDEDENAGPMHISEMFSDESDGESSEVIDNDSDDDDTSEGGNDINPDVDDDDFMDDGGDSDSDEMPHFEGTTGSNDDSDSDEMPHFEGKADSDDDSDDRPDFRGGNTASDESLDNAMFGFEDSEDDDDEMEHPPPKKGKNAKKGETEIQFKEKKKKGNVDENVYADASEYAELLAKAYGEQLPYEDNEQAEKKQKQEAPSSAGSEKKRKRKKKKKQSS